MKRRSIYKSAVTGKVVSKQFADTHPNETFRQTIYRKGEAIMPTKGKKSAADTKAVRSEVAEVKAEGRKSATSTPPSQSKTAADAAVVTAPVVVSTPTPAEDVKKAAEAAKQDPGTVTTEFKTPFQIQAEEDLRKADLNERIEAKEREERLKKAHDKYWVDPETRTEAILNSQSGEGGKLTEPNFLSEAEAHNALTAIETARLNEPDYVDAATREGGIKKLEDQMEEAPKLVGQGRDHELTDVEKERVELLRSRAEMRDIADPKNQVDKFDATEKAAEKEMTDQRKEIEKAEKALEKERADIQKQQEAEQAERLKEDEKRRKEADAEVDKERTARAKEARR